MATKILISLLLVTSSYGILEFHEYCRQENVHTLRCNHIPVDIPDGTSAVYIVDFKKESESFEINNSSFQSENWANVKYLELNSSVGVYNISIMLKSRCFMGLKHLRELHIHAISPIKLDPDTFIGLDSVKTLDMTECVRTGLGDLRPSLKGERKLPALQTLILSHLNMYHNPINIDENFTEALKDKRITYLDFSYTDIYQINISAITKYLENLQIFNMSFATYTYIAIQDGKDAEKLKGVRVFDMSYTHVAVIPGNYVVRDNFFRTSDFNDRVKYFLSPKIMNVSACFPEFVTLWINNCTVEIDETPHVASQKIIFRRNNLKRLGVTMLCSKYKLFSVKDIDAAENGLEFLHPSIMICLPNLEDLDLSDNKLYKMVNEDIIAFGRLFSSVKHLKSIDLSFNNLQVIPENQFQHNLELEHINLSNNRLEQVTFGVLHLKKLTVLDIQNNNIKVLNRVSLTHLDLSFADRRNNENIKLKVQVKNNPIACSKCNAKPFLNWLITTNSETDLYCVTESGAKHNISAGTIELIQSICLRKKIIVSVCVTTGLASLVIIASVVFLYKRYKWLKRKTKTRKLFERLNEGQGQYEFVAFLSYSSSDEDFVDDYIRGKLNENLQLMTGVDREMICTGDLYIRPGYLISDETVRCMERATIVISILSHDYCNSRGCQYELDQAYRLNKPMIFMVKDHVDEHRMMPTMKMLFKHNEKIVWTIEDNEYVLKSTWENVCKSILELSSKHV